MKLFNNYFKKKYRERYNYTEEEKIILTQK